MINLKILKKRYLFFIIYFFIFKTWAFDVQAQSQTAPNAPAISSPADGAGGVSLLPALSLSATDGQSDYLKYKIQLATDTGFTQNLQTFDQTASQTGWSGQNAPPNWYNSSWTYRKAVAITNGSGSTQTNYQVKITLDTQTLVTAGKMLNTCNDIRIVDSNGTSLSYWIEPTTCNTASTLIWVKIPSVSTSGTTLYIYYGNASATGVSSATNTFIRDISNLQGAWKLDENSGTNAADSSGNSYNGTVSGTASWTTGKFGSGISIDNSSSSYIDLVNGPTLKNTSAFTLEAWVKINTLPSSGSNHKIYVEPVEDLGSLGNPYGRAFLTLGNNDSTVGCLGTNVFSFHFRTGNASSTRYDICGTTTISTGNWYHVVGVFDSATDIHRLYVNGTQEQTLTAAVGSITNTNPIHSPRIGNFVSDFGAEPLLGKVDEVRVYNKALSATEISNLANNYGYVTTNYANHELVRKRASTEPSAGTPGTEEPGPGTIAYTSGTTATYTLQLSLSAGTTYYLRAYAIDPFGSNTWSSASATVWFSTGTTVPGTPTFISTPSTGCSTTAPVFQVTSSDPQSDYLKYRMTIATDALFSNIVVTYNQVTSQSGWSGQNAQSGAAYTSGSTATFTIPTPLNTAYTYYAKIEAIDPGGSNTWSQAASASFFTGGPPGKPVLIYPTNGTTDVSVNPTFRLSAANSGSCTEQQRFKIQLATDTAFNNLVGTYDSTVAISRWTQPENLTQGQGFYNPLISPAFTARFNPNTTAVFALPTTLSEGTTYYWRAWVINPSLLNTWSDPGCPNGLPGQAYGMFVTALGSASAPSNCITKYNITTGGVTFSWINNSTTASQIQVQKSTDGGAFALLGSLLGSSATSTTDSVTAGHSYQYRVRNENASSGVNSAWCTSVTLSL